MLTGMRPGPSCVRAACSTAFPASLVAAADRHPVRERGQQRAEQDPSQATARVRSGEDQ